MSSSVEPSEVLDKLKSTVSQRTAKTLDNIYQICIEQEERGDYNFSIPTIARLGIKRGVPKAQSIRNKQGQIYRTLLRSFSDKYSNTQCDNLDISKNDWISEIQNPKLQLLARIQASELVSANQKLRDFIPPGTRIDVRDYQNQGSDSSERLNPQERRALEYIVSAEFLKKWNFSATEYGEIVDSNGDIVLKAATVDAVDKALTHL